MRTREQEVEPLINLSEITEVELLILKRMREFTIGEHSSMFHGTGFDFVGLRGTPEEVHAIESSLNLPLSVVPDGEGADYGVGHAALVIAFSPDGQGHVGYASGALASDYAEDLPKLLAGPWSEI